MPWICWTHNTLSAGRHPRGVCPLWLSVTGSTPQETRQPPECPAIPILFSDFSPRLHKPPLLSVPPIDTLGCQAATPELPRYMYLAESHTKLTLLSIFHVFADLCPCSVRSSRRRQRIRVLILSGTNTHSWPAKTAAHPHDLTKGTRGRVATKGVVRI